VVVVVWRVWCAGQGRRRQAWVQVLLLRVLRRLGGRLQGLLLLLLLLLLLGLSYRMLQQQEQQQRQQQQQQRMGWE
jgi:hypothetical protein